jgi:5-formyltetrahydrofolate cyclo-ligase
MNKNALRRQLRAARNALGRDTRKHAGRNASRLALRLGLLLRARRIGFYLPHNAEFDVTPLLNQALWMKRDCYLPVIPRRKAQAMRFALIHDRHVMQPNRYGIHEPQDARPLRARQLDLLFVPLVGFDDDGYRLGMGGGYYDATLAYQGRRCHWRKPRLIGVGFECQRVAKLPHDPWDRPLDAVLTERQLYRFKSASQ